MTTTLPKGSIFLAVSFLADPAQYKTVSEIVRSAHLVEKLEEITSTAPSGDALNAWAKEDAQVDITDAQKVLLYQAAERSVGKIPASSYAAKLLGYLGFE